MKPKYIYLIVTDHIKCESFILGFDNEDDLSFARAENKKNRVWLKDWETYRTKKEAVKEARSCRTNGYPWRYNPNRNKMSAKTIS